MSEGYKFDPTDFSDADKALFYGISNVSSEGIEKKYRKTVAFELLKTSSSVFLIFF